MSKKRFPSTDKTNTNPFIANGGYDNADKVKNELIRLEQKMDALTRLCEAINDQTRALSSATGYVPPYEFTKMLNGYSAYGSDSSYIIRQCVDELSRKIDSSENNIMETLEQMGEALFNGESSNVIGSIHSTNQNLGALMNQLNGISNLLQRIDPNSFGILCNNLNDGMQSIDDTIFECRDTILSRFDDTDKSMKTLYDTMADIQLKVNKIRTHEIIRTIGTVVSVIGVAVATICIVKAVSNSKSIDSYSESGYTGGLGF